MARAPARRGAPLYDGLPTPSRRVRTPGGTAPRPAPTAPASGPPGPRLPSFAEVPLARGRPLLLALSLALLAAGALLARGPSPGGRSTGEAPPAASVPLGSGAPAPPGPPAPGARPGLEPPQAARPATPPPPAEPARAPRRLTVRVVDAAGVPVPRVSVRWLRPGAGPGPEMQGAGRQLELDDPHEEGSPQPTLWSGAVLEIWGARTLDDRGLPLLPARAGPLSGTERELSVRLERGALFEGRVRGPAGPLDQPVELRLRRALPADDPGWDDPGPLAELDRAAPGRLARRLPFEGRELRVLTEADGTFVLAPFQPLAAHELRVEVPDGFLEAPVLEVRAGDAPLSITLRPAVEARVKLLSPEGVPWVGAVVSASWDGARGWGLGHTHRLTDGSGETRLTGLDPEGSYRLHVRPVELGDFSFDGSTVFELEPDPERAPRVHRVEAWRPADTTLRVPAGLRLEGTVVDGAGRPVHAASVAALTEAGWVRTVSDVAGRFRLEGLPPGRASLRWALLGPQVSTLVDLDEVLNGQAEEPWPSAPGSPERVLTLEGDALDLVLPLPGSGEEPPVVRLRLPAPVDPAAGRRPLSESLGWLLEQSAAGWAFVRKVTPPDARRGERAAPAIEVDRLEPGRRYAVWMLPVGGRHVYATFSTADREVVLERVPGGVVRGRVSGLPSEGTRLHVSLSDDLGRFVRDVGATDEGRFEVAGLPPSLWTVRARCRAADDVLYEAVGTVSTGAEVRLTLMATKLGVGPRGG